MAGKLEFGAERRLGSSGHSRDSVKAPEVPSQKVTQRGLLASAEGWLLQRLVLGQQTDGEGPIVLYLKFARRRRRGSPSCYCCCYDRTDTQSENKQLGINVQ